MSALFSLMALIVVAAIIAWELALMTAINAPAFACAVVGVGLFLVLILWSVK